MIAFFPARFPPSLRLKVISLLSQQIEDFDGNFLESLLRVGLGWSEEWLIVWLQKLAFQSGDGEVLRAQFLRGLPDV